MKSLFEPTFTKNPLDRMEHIRESISDVLQATPSFFILVSGDHLLIHENAGYLFSRDEVNALGISEDRLVFLGSNNSIYYFVASVDSMLGNQFKHTDLRSFAITNVAADNDMGILAQAFSLLKWHESHQFCSACGSKNQLMCAGWRQDCLHCGKQHFPRIDPVVIMLVTHKNHCLLGAGREFQPHRYSCLAGFMEPGETIENAARRELYEETGVIGLDVHYILSQPWPFPFSLMIGLHVKAEDRKLTINYNELADARWVSKAKIAATLQGDEQYGFTLPPKIAIARALLDYWINA